MRKQGLQGVSRGRKKTAIRLAEAGIDMSVGSVIGLFKTEVAKHLGPWKTEGQLEWETMKWVHWHNKDRLH